MAAPTAAQVGRVLLWGELARELGGWSVIDWEEAKKIQDSYVKMGMKRLRQSRHLNPYVFILTTGAGFDKIKEDAKSVGWKVLANPHNLPLEQNANVAMVVDMAPTPEMLDGYIRFCWPENAKIFDTGLTIGKASGLSDEKVLSSLHSAFFMVTDMHQKDVVAAMCRAVAAKTDAYATIMLTEGWMLRASPGDEAGREHVEAARERAVEYERENPKSCDGSFRREAGSIEVLNCSLTTRKGQRMISIPILRKFDARGRDMGKVTGFGPAEDHDLSAEGAKMSGRMMDFLKQLDD
jgi:hypothetical protein